MARPCRVRRRTSSAIFGNRPVGNCLAWAAGRACQLGELIDKVRRTSEFPQSRTPPCHAFSTARDISKSPDGDSFQPVAHSDKFPPPHSSSACDPSPSTSSLRTGPEHADVPARGRRRGPCGNIDLDTDMNGGRAWGRPGGFGGWMWKGRVQEPGVSNCGLEGYRRKRVPAAGSGGAWTRAQAGIRHGAIWATGGFPPSVTGHCH
jgi:hypothetical protein